MLVDTLPVVRRPLVVDVDGTLIRSDLLVESTFALIGTDPRRIFSLPGRLSRGKAHLKASIAAETPIDVSVLPWDERVLAVIADAKAADREVWIASASNERYVAAIAEHVGADGWIASDDTTNLSGRAKADRLVERFGKHGFDYVGNDEPDLAVWANAHDCIAVHPSSAVRKALGEIAIGAVSVIEPPPGRLRAWIRLVRIHQWTKNMLVFVPALTAHSLTASTFLAAFGAFLAFSFAASAVYVLNDLVDLDADRRHPSKKSRSLAAGTVPILAALPVAASLLSAALLVAVLVGAEFTGALVTYLILTTAYSFSLKRKMLIDVVLLAALYTLRVIGGAYAVAIPVSEWLLAFSMFIFTSLALIKRYIELAARVDAELPDPTNRNYRKSDLDIVAALAAAAGFNAVTVFALWLSSPTILELYRNPRILWVACPILMYWLGRALLLAHRRQMDDDPIIFALNDATSVFCFAAIAATMIVAI
jgi:4-hydroxybenzoate polyprenyltransferase